jgi:DNA-binding transcriptional LysR family regulator
MVEFLARHPQTQIELITLERAVNLVEERIDLAVRIGRRIDEGLVARPPRTPEELSRHRCITHAFVGRSEFVLLPKGADSRPIRVPVQGALQCNETAVTRQAALDGGGIALLPTYFVGGDLVRGDLLRLLPDHEPEPLQMHAVYLSRAHQPLVLRLMLDFLAQRFGGDVAPWDREIAAAAAAPGRSRNRARSAGRAGSRGDLAPPIVQRR